MAPASPAAPENGPRAGAARISDDDGDYDDDNRVLPLIALAASGVDRDGVKITRV
jgi:hypothetical protein